MGEILDGIDDPPIRYGFIVNISDSAVFGSWKKFVSLVFVMSCCK